MVTERSGTLHTDVGREAGPQAVIGGHDRDRAVGGVLAGDDLDDQIVGRVRCRMAGVARLDIARGSGGKAVDRATVRDDDHPLAPVVGGERRDEATERLVLVALPAVGDRAPDVHGIDDDHGADRGDGLIVSRG